MNRLDSLRMALEEARQVMNVKRERYNLDKKWLSDWNKVRAFYKQSNTGMYKTACNRVGMYLSACKQSKTSLKVECARVKQFLDDIAVLRAPSLTYGICESDKAICYYLMLNGKVVSTGLWYSSISHLVKLLTFNYKLYQVYPELHQVTFDECMEVRA